MSKVREAFWVVLLTLVLVAVLAFEMMRELYVDSQSRDTWNDEPGSFDPNLVDK